MTAGASPNSQLSILKIRRPQNHVTLRRRSQRAATEMQSAIRHPQSAIARRLLLFDIDGTLIHSGGAGVQALKSAFKERFGITSDLHDLEIAGMTDSCIVVSILTKNDSAATIEHVPSFLA